MSNASLELGGDNWAAKDGNLLGYAVGDSSGKYVPREFTFTRGSNLAATRVAANGLIEKGRENLLLQSNQFDTTWTTTSSITLTSGQSGYDGSSDAWLLERTSTGGQRVAQTKSSSGVQTYSVYAKANVGDWLYMRCNTSGSPVEAYFDLANGVLGAYGSTTRIDAKIQAVGNGWYRCSMAFNSIIVEARLYPVDGNGSVVGTNESIYIQDAQLEQGLVATDYIETGASTVQAGLLEDEPRIDYAGGTASLLLEPSRTQLIPQSEYFEGGTYSVFSTTPIFTTNYGTSPQGVVNSTRLQLDAADLFGKSPNLTSSDYVFSVFAKKVGLNEIGLRIDYSGGTMTTKFNLLNGTISSSTSDDADIIDYGNGWYRCWILASSKNIGNYVVTAGGVPADCEIFGLQLEEASYPTSYIPNHSGGSVTRGVDFTTKTGLTSSINSTEGTMFLDFKALANTLPSEYSHFSMSNGTYNNRIAIFQSTGATNEVRVLAFVGGTKVFDLNGSVTDITTQTKVALRYAENAFDLFINGAKVATDTSGSIFPANTLDRVSFSEIGTTAKTFKGKVKQALVFPTALSDAQCSALTVEGLKEEILTSYIAAVDTLEDGAEARLDTYLQNLEELIV